MVPLLLAVFSAFSSWVGLGGGLHARDVKGLHDRFIICITLYQTFVDHDCKEIEIHF